MKPLRATSRSRPSTAAPATPVQETASPPVSEVSSRAATAAASSSQMTAAGMPGMEGSLRSRVAMSTSVI